MRIHSRSRLRHRIHRNRLPMGLRRPIFGRLRPTGGEFGVVGALALEVGVEGSADFVSGFSAVWSDVGEVGDVAAVSGRRGARVEVGIALEFLSDQTGAD